MGNIFSGRLQYPALIQSDTLTTVNLTAFEFAGTWWNPATWRLDIPAGFNAIEVQASCLWECATGGLVRRLVVQSQDLLAERADNRLPVTHAIFLATNQVTGFFYNPTLAPLSLMVGAYQDSGVAVQLFEAALFVRCAIE